MDVSAQGLMGEDNAACSLRGKQVNLKVIAKEFIYSVKIKKKTLTIVMRNIIRSSFIEVHVIIGRYIYGRFCIQKHHDSF